MSEGGGIFVAGHRGLVGSAIVRRLRMAGGERLLLRSRSELDLTNQAAVRAFFEAERPSQVYLAAAKVGGILANDTRPAEFIQDNLVIQSNIIDAAYPKHAPQPMPEECLLTGPLEPTNEWYAIAKIAGLKTCQAYRKQYGFDAICAMPTNLYGPGDNFDLQSSHVLPALIRKFVAAVEQGAADVEIWGTGTPRREFLHVDDLADACVHLMDHYSDAPPVNLGWGQDVSIAELAGLVAQATGFKGQLRFDTSKPDGTPRKLLDTTRLTKLGWRPSIALGEGVRQTVAWYLAHRNEATRAH
jgi:GDP-L-fucose synthase